MAATTVDGKVGSTNEANDSDKVGTLLIEVTGLDKIASDARNKALKDAREAFSSSALTPEQERALLNLSIATSGIQQEFTGAVITGILSLRGAVSGLTETDKEIQALYRVSNFQSTCQQIVGSN